MIDGFERAASSGQCCDWAVPTARIADDRAESVLELLGWRAAADQVAVAVRSVDTAYG